MREINSMGDKCPLPVIKAKNVLKEMENNEQLLILVDNEIATQNLSKLADENGSEYSVEKISNDEYKVFITKKEFDVNHSKDSADKNIVIAVTSDKMGAGSDELGEVLMKGFIYALTESDILPKTIIFYNGGAKLTSEGSKSIEDLNKLKDMGVEILTCGACMDYYNIKDKLQVGEISNMYSIAEKLLSATSVVRP